MVNLVLFNIFNFLLVYYKINSAFFQTNKNRNLYYSPHSPLSFSTEEHSVPTIVLLALSHNIFIGSESYPSGSVVKNPPAMQETRV